MACAWPEKGQSIGQSSTSEGEDARPPPIIADDQLQQLREAARMSSATPFRELVFDAAPAWMAGVSLEGVYVPRDLPLEERMALVERRRAEEQEWATMQRRVEVLESELQAFQYGEPRPPPQGARRDPAVP